jgi:type IV secretory pathway ATPase VirB11/archaellum biosynthesis ATPase
MPAKTERTTTNAERVAKSREKTLAAGGRRLTIVLQPETNDKLNRLIEKHSSTATSVIEWLINSAKG